MEKRRSVRLLGRPLVRVGASTHEPAPTKASALLLYLAYAGAWVPRDDLVYLLWPDKGETRARSNLRQLLYSLNDVAFANGVERDADRLRWQVTTDLEPFRDAVGRGDHRAATDAYGGRLLEGFGVDRIPEFQSWLEMEREQLHGEWRRACLAHGHALRSSGRHDAAGDCLERLLHHDPLDEHVLRDLVATLAEAGRHTEALETYRSFERRLQHEIGMAPAPETAALVEAIRDRTVAPSLTEHREEPPSVAASPRPSSRLPVDTTAFVGRDVELGELARSIAEHRVRLVNLVAPGGMGKTRLALALARSLQGRFLDGAAFASFGSVEHPSQMDAALADALGLQPSSHLPVRDQLLLHLSELDILLVLDQLEHLTGDLSMLEAVLERCPNATLVTTSRERLGLRAEWGYDVRGLGAASESAELFVRTARRMSGHLRADDLDRDEVHELCRMIRGMPLAIILAAGWLRVMSLSEIRDELTRGLDILASPRTSAPGDRHASIRSVLDSTWERLRSPERTAWMELSVTEGSFDREAAQAIAGIGPSGLLALMNKAILTRSERRFDMHPLVRTYGRERADVEGMLADARSRHARYYLNWIVERASGFEGRDQMEVVRHTTRELPNLRAAWRAAAEFGWGDLLTDAAHGMATYHEILGLRSELATLAEAAITALGGLVDVASTPIEQQRAIGRVLPFAHELPGSYAERAQQSLTIARRAEDDRGLAEAHLHLVWASDVPDRQNADEARAAFERLGNEHGIARTDVALGWPLVLHGFYQEGIDISLRAAERFRGLGDERLTALALDNMTPGHIMLGDFGRAEELLTRQEEINRRIGVWTVDVQSLGTRQWLEIERGNYEAAARYQDAFHDMYERAGQDMTTNRLFLGSQNHYRAGRYDDAWAAASAYVDSAHQGGHRHLGVLLLVMILARVAIRSGDPGGAVPHLREAAEIALDLGSPRFLMDTAVGAAEWLYATDRADLAAQLVAAADADPATEVGVRVAIEYLRSTGLDDSRVRDSRGREWVRTTLVELFDRGA